MNYQKGRQVCGGLVIACLKVVLLCIVYLDVVIITERSSLKWMSCHYGNVHPQVVDGGDGV